MKLALLCLCAQTPYVAPASDEGERAIAAMKVPPGFEVELWAAEPDLANPVALSVAPNGDVYVAETFRLKQGVDDIRDHMDWLDDDVACRTVENRLAYLEKHLKERFADYSIASERVRWLRDGDGDGRADQSSVFADSFAHASAGIAAGVLALDERVFFTCIPALWELRDGDGDHRADSLKELSTGYGVRFALIGHDLHGLALGPDGKLYFSCGDRGLSVPMPDGSRLRNEFSGAVLRCNLDGGELELFATGLRNPQELVFDDYGELFTVDNNSDGGDKARLVHVIEGMDAGWRQSYQWLEEPNLRGPWNDEGLWKPHFEGQAAYIVPPLANICDGPSGLAFNPGTALTTEWRNHFFICDFRGSRSSSGIRAFTLKEKSASFELDEFKDFVTGTLVTDCDFGPDGNLYWTDWVEGWGKTGKGRIYRLLESAPAIPLRPLADELRLIRNDSLDSSVASRLSDPDRRVRFAAQFELARRKAQGALFDVAHDSAQPKLARLHAVWGLGMCASRRVADLHDVTDEHVFGAAVRVIGDIHRRGPWMPHIAANWGMVSTALDHPSPIVRREAALAIGRGMCALDGEVEGLHERVWLHIAQTRESDAALRHALIAALAQFDSEGNVTVSELSGERSYGYRLIDAASHESVDARVGTVVALRRLGDPEVATFLRDTDERVVVEAARAIYDVPIEAAYPALAALIEREDLTTTALARRVLNANFRLGAESNAEALAKFVTRADADGLHRWEALDLLSKWEQPPGRDALTGEWWPLPKRDVSFLPRFVSDMRKAGIASAPERVLGAWIELAAACGARNESATLIELARDAKRPVAIRAAALRAATKLAPDALQPALAELGVDAEAQVRAAALEAAASLTSPVEALPMLSHAARNGSLAERRVAYSALAAIESDEVDALLAHELDKLRASLVPPEVALDLVVAAEQRNSGHVVHALTALREPRAIDPPLAPFVDSLHGGDRERGRKLFRENQQTTCLKCHRIEWNEGGEVGPDLNGAGKRLTRVELLAAIADPNRAIARGYEGVVLTLDDETFVSGVVVAESPERVKLRTAQDELVEVDASRIAARRSDLSSMPQNVASFLSREDMRDLIEYLASL